MRTYKYIEIKLTITLILLLPPIITELLTCLNTSAYYIFIIAQKYLELNL